MRQEHDINAVTDDHRGCRLIRKLLIKTISQAREKLNTPRQISHWQVYENISRQGVLLGIVC